MTESERWVDSWHIFEIIKLAKNRHWKWENNQECKYIEVRIDMRDGHCIIRNRHGDEMTLEGLREQ